MHHIALNLARRAPRTLPVPTRLFAQTTGAAALQQRSSLLPSRTYATSSPKEAEEASAQSGGSRSKDAAEAAVASADASEEGGDVRAKGRTGGGEPLESSENAPPRPKVHNAKVPLGGGRDNLTKEQQEEVDRHNADFEKKHDRASKAGEDKVDKDFWKGSGGRDGR